MTTSMPPFEQSFAMPTSADMSPTATEYYGRAPLETDPYFVETFHQFPHGDFRPTFYNPFEIKHRRRTSRAQLKVLEKAFAENAKPNATVRRILAQKLDMTPRGVQIWFQNRRAKAKLQRRKDANDNNTRHFTSDNQHSYQSPPNSQQNEMTDSPQRVRTAEQMEQTVLFSQFSANVQPQPEYTGKPAFTSHLPPAPACNKSMKSATLQTAQTWQATPWQADIRSAAAVAVAAAAAATSTTNSRSDNWLTPTGDHGAVQQLKVQEQRRQSCPVVSDHSVLQQQQEILGSYPFDLASWYVDTNMSEDKQRRSSDSEFDYSQASTLLGWHTVSRTYSLSASSPSNSSNTSNDANTPCLQREWPLDANMCSPLGDQRPVIPMDLYSFSDIQLTYPPLVSNPQLTPPLVSSCSVSPSVDGSPVSMHGYYDCLPAGLETDMTCCYEGSTLAADTLSHTPSSSSSSPAASTIPATTALFASLS